MLFCFVRFCAYYCIVHMAQDTLNWSSLYEHFKYSIFIKMFIFNDIRKLSLGHKNTAL